MKENEITEPPRGALTSAGKKIWHAIMDLSMIDKDADYETVLLLCKLTDERRMWESELKKADKLIWINAGTNIIVNPAYKRINEIDRNLQSLFSVLGLSPASRSKLAMETALNPLDDFLKSTILFKNQVGNDDNS